MTHDPTILAFDTSGPYCAAALLVRGQIAATRRESMTRGQAEALFPMLDDLLAEAGTGWEVLDAIAVGTGPGNFTGTRIAVSAARGLSLSLNIPAFGVTGFEAMQGSHWYSMPEPMIVSLAPSRINGGALLQYFENGTASGDPWEESLSGNGPTSGRRFETAPLVIGYQAATFDRLLTKHTGGSETTDFCDTGDLSQQERIATIAALKMAEGLPHTRPSPVYLRPADAAPSSDKPPAILP